MVQKPCSFLKSAIFKSQTLTSATPTSLCSHYREVAKVTYSEYGQRDKVAFEYILSGTASNCSPA